MIGLCIPLASRFRRGGGLGALFAIGVGLGFLYFVIDGISLTMGELGFVAPWLAAWLPLLAVRPHCCPDGSQGRKGLTAAR